MITLYFWTTPNGYKPLILLNELGIDYRIEPVNISTGAQFEKGFLAIAPNNRIPAIIDDAPVDGEGPLSLFESGAILEYLADKRGQLLPSPAQPRQRFEVLQWLYWQMGGLGPMAGQNHHFVQYAPQQIAYAIQRYVNETSRLYAVMNKQLAAQEFLAGNYSIADIACYPWIVPHAKQRQNLADYPHLQAWFERIGERPAVKAAYTEGAAINTNATVTEESRTLLFGQSADTVARNPSVQPPYRS
ncbi:glutathione binding-like protein [Motiliproteus sediminis]|uniref:glutathione binding-like protein n=1 Tax=Motiliproteus sediminis TaxID=1468178 RepID=UPI001AF01C84|nr:glutathione binding-like protein [Motiliproteus sediminis]